MNIENDETPPDHLSSKHSKRGHKQVMSGEKVKRETQPKEGPVVFSSLRGAEKYLKSSPRTPIFMHVIIHRLSHVSLSYNADQNARQTRLGPRKPKPRKTLFSPMIKGKDAQSSSS